MQLAVRTELSNTKFDDSLTCIVNRYVELVIEKLKPSKNDLHMIKVRNNPYWKAKDRKVVDVLDIDVPK